MHPRTKGQTLAAVASVLLLSACDPGSDKNSSWTTVDSSGVAILAGPPPQNTFGVLGDVPLLEVSEAADLPLFRTSRVLPRGDGSFLALDAGNHRVLLFAPTGTLRASVGQRGDGPGEFQAPSVMALAADSVLVYDRRHRRVTVLGPDLEFVRDQLLSGRDGFGTLRFAGTTGPHRWIGLEGVRNAGLPSAGLLRSPVSHVVIESDGPRPIVQNKGTESWVNVQTEGGQITSVNVFAHPFYRRTLEATGVGHLVVGDTDDWTLSDYADSGELRRRIRMDQAPEPFGSETLEDYLDTLVDLTPDERREREQSFEGMSVPSSLPAFSALLIDDRDRLWVQAFNLDAGAEQRWIVFGEEGALGVVHVPARLTVSAIHDDTVWGVFRDELDVESIRAYPFEGMP